LQPNEWEGTEYPSLVALMGSAFATMLMRAAHDATNAARSKEIIF
jgi:hypothetical protein